MPTTTVSNDDPKVANPFAQIMAKRYQKPGSPIQDLADVKNPGLRNEVKELLKS